jgi:tripeptidyl-peptidase-1
LYGAHLSQKAIDAIISPKDESRELVMQWLNDEGLGKYVSMSPRMDSVVVQASISQIEKLLNAEYNAFGEQSLNAASNFMFKVCCYEVFKQHLTSQ